MIELHNLQMLLCPTVTSRFAGLFCDLEIDNLNDLLTDGDDLLKV
jgi:hypothetical protein